MRKLMEYLPEKYENSRETVAFQEAIQPEATKLWEARNEFLRQLSPKTAEGWGLALWEEAFGIKPASDAGLEQRRSRVVAKLRGVGTVTAEMLKAVVESFLVHDVEVTERPRENWVDVLYSTAGVRPPPDMESLLETLWEIFPAHLGLTLVSEAETAEAKAVYVPSTTSFSSSPLPEWRQDYEFRDTVQAVPSTAAISVSPMPEWRMDYAMRGTLRAVPAASAISVTELPEWQMDYSMAGHAGLAGGFWAISTTTLPPYEG